MSHTYQVKLDTFEGPLDLLLHLINKFEIDIYDIPMAEITHQYMDYIHTMQKLELNVASEYLVMAATLVAIKSQMLLPKQEILDEVEEEYMEDPREELIGRLIEYRKYKEAASKLQEKELEESHLFTRAPVVFEELTEEKPIVKKGDLSVYDMLHALGKMFQRKKWDEPLDTKISRAEIPIEERMKDVLNVVKTSKNGVAFDSLFPFPSRTHIVVTFMALLELMKNNSVYCEQENNFETLYVFYAED
ncbi:segregation/condensation protein A [Oceanobacillus piezotolerans]|uniref:Segregation and condensation protein A n=1 Tax=Oceanobacillus piezotolerans TaxID=2448030 RepID=A0A498DD67_9BACI|nr:segregation/condensation protein A [Oceanobacillus piezotolerans]RLL48162.1 segregation/condensation protein A [Oceanobacillus piezotolerans]